MRGHLRQRGNGWELRVYAGKDQVTGTERYVTKTVKGCGKREAERMLNELVVAAERGTLARTRATVGELLDAWFELARADFSPKTVRETAGFIKRDLRPALGHVPLARLSAANLDRFYAELRSGRKRPALSPATIRRLHGILHRALAQGMRWGWLGANVAASASPPRVPRPTLVALSPADLGRLMEVADRDDPDFAVFLVLAACTGARRSELIALRWRNIDFERQVVILDRGIVFGPDGLVEKDTKTHACRRVSLDEATVAALAAHQARMSQRAESFGAVWSATSFVFSDACDAAVPWYPDSASRSFRRVCRAANVQGVRLHDLRHYVATQLLVNGVDVRTVAGRLGHRDASTTLNVYAHFLASSDVKAAELLATLVPDRRRSE